MVKDYHFSKKKSIILILAVFLLLPDFLYAATPNDDAYPEQKKFWDTVNLEQAWDMATGSPEVVVAVIDTGADIWHRDLEKNIWVNPYEIADNNIDDDGNGYIDDINGWNFIEGNNNVRPDVFAGADDPEAVRHGTVIAGLIGEQGNNGRNGVGVNWQVKIMPLRAIDSTGAGYLEDVASAVDYAVNNGAMVISLSVVSGDANDVLKSSLRRAYEKGAVIVVAAGNDSLFISGSENPVYPACFDQGDPENWIITVGSIHPEKKLLSWFSNYGDCVDLYAPGDNIYSIERYAPQFGYNDEFGGPWRGTSFATPIVTGAAALLKSVHPDWKADKIRDVLLETASTFYLDKAQQMPAKIVDIGAAVKNAFNDDRVIGDITYSYYLNKNEIYRRDQFWQSRMAIARLADVKVLNLASKTSLFGTTDLATLIQRSSHYYVRLYKENGVWWQEFSLAKEKLGSETQNPKKITLKDGNVEAVYFFKKKTRYVTYDRLGNKVISKDVLNQKSVKK